MEQTFAMIKPDGVKRQLVGQILQRYEDKGLTIEAMRWFTPSRELVEEHYKEHKDKPFFSDLVQFLTSGPVLALQLSGNNAVQAVRQINGATNPIDAAMGSIRGDFGLTLDENVVHGSDSQESAQRELELWFSKG